MEEPFSAASMVANASLPNTSVLLLNASFYLL